MNHIKLFEKFIETELDIKLENLTNNLTKIDINNILTLVEKHKEEIGEDYVEHIKSKIKGNKRYSEELSNKIGMKEDLVGDWKYPFGEDYVINEFLIVALNNLIYNDIVKEEEEMIKLFNLYKEINPIIESIPHDDYYKCYEILMGMTSGFNYDDIYDFIVIGGGSSRGDEYMNKHEYASSLVGGHLAYVASEKTLDKIIKKLE